MSGGVDGLRKLVIFQRSLSFSICSGVRFVFLQGVGFFLGGLDVGGLSVDSGELGGEAVWLSSPWTCGVGE